MIENRDAQSIDIKELAGALAIAQGQMNGVKKDAKNPFFKSSYASLDSVWETIREPLSKNGLSVVQTTEHIGDRDYVRTILLHSSGGYIDGLFPIVLGEKKDAQAVGSAVSYSRRYALMAICGVAPHDDDGEAAVGRLASTPKTQPVQVTPKALFPSNSPKIPPEAKELLDRLNRDNEKGEMPFELIDEPPPLLEEHSVVSVGHQKAIPSDDYQLCCGKKMNVSKFNPEELYCFNCKSKRSRY